MSIKWSNRNGIIEYVKLCARRQLIQLCESARANESTQLNFHDYHEVRQSLRQLLRQLLHLQSIMGKRKFEWSQKWNCCRPLFPPNQQQPLFPGFVANQYVNCRFSA
ncbi:uncharacterized protein LOC116850148 [Odontomachus brunneus]|uniref:uncharacterized protein LOC116850148 n=1 Tax=Odontomachus brunneus TaxID=486640 RepID=UPI0013F2AB35|nr:uncharacterized protein LOC116850148 [Odontomachus brunneus]